MRRLTAKRQLYHESLEQRWLLAADLEVEIAPYAFETPGAEVTRVVRVYNNGDERADSAIVQSNLSEQLVDATWVRALASSKVVDLGNLDPNDADFLLSSASGFHWQPLGDINHDGYLDFGIWENDFGRRAWILFGGHPETRLEAEGPMAVDSDAQPEAPVAIQIFRHTPLRRFRFEKLGDVNGDGIDDFSVDRHVVWGDMALSGPIEIPAAPYHPVVLPDRFARYEATVIGDINQDGYVDYGLDLPRKVGEPIEILLGRPAESTEPIKTISFPCEHIYCRSSFHDAGDLNGDGVDDVLMSFQADSCDCTSYAQEFYATNGGVKIGFGHVDIGFRTISEERLRPMTLRTMGSVKVDARDRNADGIDDLIVNGNVVFGGAEIGEFGQSAPEYGAFSPASFTGDNGYSHASGRHDAAVLLDVNSDGKLDRVVHQGKHLAVFLAGGEPDSLSKSGVSGVGDIAETITIPAGMSVIYTATGKLRPQPATQPFAFAAIPEARETLADNVYPRSEQPSWVQADIRTQIRSASPDDGTQLATVEIQLWNQGLEAVEYVQLDETLSEQLSDVTWSIEGLEFPSSAVVGQLGPYQEGIDLAPGPWTKLEQLGQDVGTLGDINGDGYPELYATNSTGMRIYWGGEHLGSTSLTGPWGTTDISLSGFTKYPREQGAVVKPLGDINADGFADFLTVEDERNDQPEYGTIYLGGPQDSFPSEDRIISRRTGTAPFARHFGQDLRRLTLAGDLNGDGHSDYLADGRILLGTRDGILRKTDRPNGYHMVADSLVANGRFYPLGDINDDGLDDLALNTSTVEVAILLGSAEMRADTELDIQALTHGSLKGFYISESCLGCSASGGHDANGDGVHDIILRGTTKGEQSNEAVLVLWQLEGGQTDVLNLSASEGVLIEEADQWGDSVFTSSVGDFDGDGVAELVVAEFQTAHLFELEALGGRQKLADLVSDQRFTSAIEFPPDGDTFSSTHAIVSPATDANGDGLDDFLLGRRPNRYWYQVGEIGLVLGQQPLSMSGSGELGSQTIRIPLRDTVTIRIDGMLAADTRIEGEVEVTVDEAHVHLFKPDVQTVQLGVSPETADLNSNGLVDFADFLILSANFGTDNPTPQMGDIDGSLAIDFDDFLLLAWKFGRVV